MTKNIASWNTLGCQIDEYTRLFGTKETWRKKQTQRQTKVFNKNPPYSFIWPYAFNWHLRVHILRVEKTFWNGSWQVNKFCNEIWIACHCWFITFKLDSLQSKFRFYTFRFNLMHNQVSKYLIYSQNFDATLLKLFQYSKFEKNFRKIFFFRICINFSNCKTRFLMSNKSKWILLIKNLEK